MIDQEKFDLIKSKHGHFASWAVWANEGEKPKDNISDLSVFDIERNGQLLRQLNPDVVFVGLNISRSVEKPLGNFHDSRPQGIDYKIRYALKDSPFWGGYMTDIIKDFEEKVSVKMMSYLKTDKQFEAENIELFRKELKDLGTVHPTVIAFGNDAFTILKRNFKSELNLVKIPHYSCYIAKEEYRDKVKTILGF